MCASTLFWGCSQLTRVDGAAAAWHRWATETELGGRRHCVQDQETAPLGNHPWGITAAQPRPHPHPHGDSR